MRNYTLLFAWLLIMVSNLALSQTWTWTGNAGNDWSNGGNWSQGSIPDPTSAVSIPGTLADGKPWPVLSGPVNIAGLTLLAGSQLNLGGQKITASGSIRITGATLTNSGELQAEGNSNSYIRSSEFGGSLVVRITGSGTFDEADATGANTYNGDAAFKLESTGAANISDNFRSLFKGSLTIERTASGTTNIFTGNTVTSVAVKGDFSYQNHAGGNTIIGGTANKTILEKEINIDIRTTGSHPSFTLRRLDNGGGAGGGVVSIVNPGALMVTNDTLKLAGFAVTGKWSNSSSVTSDFDQNTLTLGSGGFSYADAGPEGETSANVGPLYFSRGVVNGTASFISNGGASFYDGLSGRGPNTFNGNAAFTANGPGALYLSYYFKSVFNGNLTVARTHAGITDIFIADGANSVGGDFSYANPEGGPTRIGVGSGGTTIGGKVNILAGNSGSTALFTLNRLDNAAGDAGGTIAIDRPSSLVVIGNTLKVQRFTVTGKWSNSSSVISDFDQNTLTLGSGGFSYADAGPGEETPANVGPLYFSRGVVNGTASFISNGGASFYDGWSGRGANQFNGNVTFSRNGTGMVGIGQYFTSSFAADLSFESAAGIQVGTNGVRFNGATNSAFSHTGVSESVFPRLLLEKTGDAELIPGVPVHITNSVTFTTGYVRASESSPLVFRSGSGYSDAGDDSHVIGPVHKAGNTAFTFPVGNGTTYHPVSISAPGGASHVFSAEYKPADPVNYNPGSFAAPLEKVSDEGYWDVRRLEGSSGVHLTLTYNVPAGFITEPNDLRVAHWSGSGWESMNSTTEEGSSNTMGAIRTQNPVTSFSPFALATTNDDANPLPVKLAEFSAVQEGASVQLRWMTAEEADSDSFELEHSADARHWKALARVKAKGMDSYPARYAYTHADPLPGNNYYRLRMTDLDGTFAYSDIRIVNTGYSSARLAVYPNPAVNYLHIQSSSSSVISSLDLVNFSGIRLRHYEKFTGAGLEVGDLSPGLYVLTIRYEDNSAETHRIVIKK